jgi:spermidine/putrescine transport system ATP-binding protein/putrescine transport system ATP-binding protein
MAAGRLEQVDAPVELYERPATLFVAGFIGSNNLFAGTATEDGVEVPGLGILPAERSGVPTGEAAHLAVRPEHVEIVPAEGARLAGTVIDTQFYGGVSTLAVQLPGYDRPVRVTRPGATRLERDASVGLAWPPSRSVVLATTRGDDA